MGSGFSFHVEIVAVAVRTSAGKKRRYLELSKKRGFPRIKPPFPTTHMAIWRPTAINNVETPVCCARGLCGTALHGSNSGAQRKAPGEARIGQQARQSPGRYEIVRASLRAIVENYCDGIVGNLRAVLMGGAAGTFLTSDEIDVPLHSRFTRYWQHIWFRCYHGV
jgi:NADH-quinone oxidoreductase subunit F